MASVCVVSLDHSYGSPHIDKCTIYLIETALLVVVTQFI